jgi:hypothetical protein
MLDEADPIAGMFFLQSLNDPNTCRAIAESTENVVATGMAFLASSDGILVTCAHVIAAMRARPGDEVVVHSSVVPVSVKATVLSEKWIGPMPNEDGYPEYVFYPGFRDKSPDVFKEDVALLRLDPNSAGWHKAGIYGVAHGQNHLVRKVPCEKTPLETFYKYVRVLPLAAPGYRRESFAPLSSWLTEWTVCQYGLRLATSNFMACELGRNQYNAVLLQAPQIREGVSGSPLWDTERQRVVGMVRETLGKSMPGHARATDARFLATLSGVRLRVDSKFQQFYSGLRAGAAAPPETNFADAGLDTETPFIEPRLSLFRLEDPLAQEERLPPVGARSAIPAIIANSPMSLLVGRAGCGKTTLLYRTALWCIDQHWQIGNQPLVPIIIKATDLIGHKESLLGLLRRLRTRNGLHLDESSILSSLEQNDAAVLLLVDGLDEVRAEHQKFAMQRLNELIKPGAKADDLADTRARPLVRHVMATSRPLSGNLLDEQGRTRHGHQMFEIELFDRNEVNGLAEAYFADAEDNKNFLFALGSIGWYRDKPTPLQVRLAADVYRETGALPQHVRSLTSKLVDLRIAKCSTAVSLFVEGPAAYLNVYCREIGWILEFLASCPASGETVTLSDVIKQLRELYNNGNAPEWLNDPSGVAAFIRTEGARQTGLFWFSDVDGDDSPNLTWFHLTIKELLLARWHRRHLLLHPDAVRRCFKVRIGDEVELHLLSILEEEGHSDLVSLVLRDWMHDIEDSSFRPSKKAVYALGAGIDACGKLRGALVRKLLHVVLCEFNRSYLCRQLYSDQSLPDLLRLVKSPKLREDVLEAFTARFQLRKLRNTPHGIRPVVQVTEREARLLDEVALWAALGARFSLLDTRPDKAGESAVAPTPGQAPTEMQFLHYGQENCMPGNATTVILRDRDDLSHTIHFDSRHFVEELTLAARALPEHSGLDLVALVAQIALRAEGRLRERRPPLR